MENLYLKLAEGHRMEKPEFCTDDMYLVMLDCWQAKPVMRPNFTELVERVGSMVDDNVRKVSSYFILKIFNSKSILFILVTPPLGATR